jgi:hypothetical protein
MTRSGFSSPAGCGGSHHFSAQSPPGPRFAWQTCREVRRRALQLPHYPFFQGEPCYLLRTDSRVKTPSLPCSEVRGACAGQDRKHRGPIRTESPRRRRSHSATIVAPGTCGSQRSQARMTVLPFELNRQRSPDTTNYLPEPGAKTGASSRLRAGTLCR